MIRARARARTQTHAEALALLDCRFSFAALYYGLSGMREAGARQFTIVH